MKKFVKIKDNKCDILLRDYFTLGCKVVIVDGSYMLRQSKKVIHGVDFQKRDKNSQVVLHELLTIVDINKSFPTGKGLVDCLSPINNCKLQGADGEIYYASNLNMVRFQ